MVLTANERQRGHPSDVRMTPGECLALRAVVQNCLAPQRCSPEEALLCHVGEHEAVPDVLRVPRAQPLRPHHISDGVRLPRTSTPTPPSKGKRRATIEEEPSCVVGQQVV